MENVVFNVRSSCPVLASLSAIGALNPDALARMAALLQRVPTYVFEVGDIEEAPKAISRLLRGLLP